MEKVDLNRYELIGLLGSGADYEVRSAIDRETGAAVVIKRPVPQMISRKMHGPIDARTQRTVGLHEEVANNISGVCPMVGFTDVANHDHFFNDGLEQDYLVTVSHRAAGMPLVGDPMARILRVPIGLGQNLFCLYPLCYAESLEPFPVQRQLLDAEEGFYAAGYVLLDLGPQNIFFQPDTALISIIDPGALLTPDNDRVAGSRWPQDIHDFYLEMLKFYCAPETPPTDVAGYRDPANMRPAVDFRQELVEMGRRISSNPDSSEEMRTCGSEMVSRVQERSYREFGEFRADFMSYLEAIRQRNGNWPGLAQAVAAWKQAAELLREDHWTKYDFSPETAIESFTGFPKLPRV